MMYIRLYIKFKNIKIEQEGGFIMKTLRQYEVVLEIARWGSVSKAAEALNVAQPTISKLLQKLESELGVELFDRTSVPISPTEAGARYIEAGRKILDADHQFEKELVEIKSNRDRKVTIGISPSRARYMLPGLITGFAKRSPETKIVIRERTTDQLNAELARGDLDLIINLSGENTGLFTKVRLFQENTLLAVPSEYYSLSPEEIIKTRPMIAISSWQLMGKAVHAIMDDIGGKTPAVECQTFESALALTQQGLGATLVPSYMAGFEKASETANVRFLRLPEKIRKKYAALLEREVCLFYRKDQFLTSSEKEFIDVCRNIKLSGTE